MKLLPVPEGPVMNRFLPDLAKSRVERRSNLVAIKATADIVVDFLKIGPVAEGGVLGLTSHSIHGHGCFCTSVL